MKPIEVDVAAWIIYYHKIHLPIGMFQIAMQTAQTSIQPRYQSTKLEREQSEIL